VLVLGLSGSRGASLALGVGLCVLVALRSPGTRVAAALAGGTAIVVGGGAWAVAVRLDAGGLELLGLVAVAALVGGLTRLPERLATRRVLALLAASTSIAVVGVAIAQPVATTTSFRSAYWAVALDEAHARPALGSGAGSFHLTWGKRGQEGLFVRDAHSLYVEALSELGPVGLALVLAIVAIPIATAVRRRGDPLVAVSGATFAVFAVHAGLDWDWEMPVVTLAALGCAAAVLTRPSVDRQGGN
jgi:O-antigen ligase